MDDSNISLWCDQPPLPPWRPSQSISSKAETFIISGPLTLFLFVDFDIQPAYVVAHHEIHLQHIIFSLFTLLLVLILSRENNAEAKKIFVNDW